VASGGKRMMLWGKGMDEGPQTQGIQWENVEKKKLSHDDHAHVKGKKMKGVDKPTNKKQNE